MTVDIACHQVRGTIRTEDGVALVEVNCGQPVVYADLAMVLKEAIGMVLGIQPDMADAKAEYEYLQEVFGKMDEQEMTVDELLTVNMEMEAIEREMAGLPPAYVEMED